jgi:hypothetical protein
LDSFACGFYFCCACVRGVSYLESTHWAEIRAK